MIDKKFLKTIDKAVASILEGRLSEAFALLRTAAPEVDAPGLAADIDKLEKRYYYFLRFIGESSGEFSPEKDIRDISDAAMELVGKTVAAAYMKSGDSAIGSQLRFERLRPEDTFESVVSDFLSELARLRKDIGAITDTRSRSTLERLGNDIFKRIWAAQVVSEDMERLVESLILDSSVPSYFREQMVSAVGLGTDVHNAPRRIAILREAMTSDNSRIALNAEIWLAIAMVLTGMRFKSGTLPHIEQIYHAAIRAILPVDRPAMPDLMNLGRSMADKSFENPDLSGKDYEAIHKIYEAQARGEDVFGGMLSHMRNFPFFSDIANWFMPFHSDNSVLADIVDGEGAAVAELMESVPALNDADKYALMLSLSMMPENLRQTQLSAMVDGLHRLSGTEEFRRALEESKLTDTMLIGQFTGNIHRFLTENKDGRELRFATFINDIFYNLAKLLPDNADFSQERELVRKLSASKRDGLALDLFRHLPAENDAETLAAAALSAERKNLVEEAQILYRLALGNDGDNLPALAGLSRIRFGRSDYATVIALLEPKDELIADNPELLRILGVAYLRTGSDAKALAVFHNLDYITNDGESKALIATAMTAGGDLENADIYFLGALESVGSCEAYIRRGIHLWICGNRNDAVDFFRKAYKTVDGDSKHFVAELHTAAQEIHSEKFNRELPLVPEIIRYGNRENAD